MNRPLRAVTAVKLEQSAFLVFPRKTHLGGSNLTNAGIFIFLAVAFCEAKMPDSK